jgi:hypothetical protein
LEASPKLGAGAAAPSPGVNEARRIVDHLAIRAELHRLVRIAFARGEGIAERHDEEILDHHLVLDELAAVGQLDLDRDSGLGTIDRVGHARDGEPVLAGELLALGLAAGLARLPAPDAVAGRAGELLGRNADRDRVRLREDVVLFRRAPGILALAHRCIAAGTPVAVVAGLAHGLRRPAEPALLVTLAGRCRATVRVRGILAVGIVELAFGAPDDVGRQRAGRIAARRVERGLVQGK